MFPSYARKAREVLEGKSKLENEDDFRELLCGDCPFYHHGEEENEECGSYLLLKAMLKSGLIDLEATLDALQ